MTTKQIHEALKQGRVVVLRDAPHLCIVPDLFGELVVVSWQQEEEPAPVRVATPSDKRKAMVYRVKSEK